MVFTCYPFDNPEERRRNLPDKLQRMITRIVNSELRFPGNPEISKSLKDLICRILEKDPEKRITIEGIMRHPWFLKNLPSGALEMNNKLQRQKSGLQVLCTVHLHSAVYFCA